MDKSKTKQQFLLDNEELRTRLEEAEETLRAIRSGEVDALVVSGTQGDQIYTLKGADRSYRILFETMEEGAATLSNDGTILYCNRRLATMLEEPLEKVIGSSLDKYLSLKDWQNFQNTFKKGEGVTGREEFHIKTANGGLLPTLVTFSTLQVGDVRGICITATDLTRQKRVEEELRQAHDELEIRVQERTEELARANRALQREITERKRMEEELRRSHDELELRVQERTAEVYRQAELLDLAHDAIIVREVDGAITFWNEGATEMYGWTKEEALGKIARDLLQTQFPFPRDKIMAELLREGRWEGELTHTRKDGKKVNILGRWALQRDAEERPISVMLIYHDITQRLKLEEQLRQAQKMEAIGTLTGGIAHDFNNILGAIVINSEMALFDLPWGSSLRTYLDLILKSGLRGKDLVKQMLLFSRKSEKKQEALTLTPLIKETFKLLRSSIPTTVQMKLLLETESDAVSADPSQVQQVIMNLCTNAAYAMRGTTGSIDISLQRVTLGSTDLPEADMQPGDYLVLSVKDTGSGMDEEVRRRVFEPFFTTKPVGEGTGLGLSVVYGIVKNHKGGITVDSEPDKGSIFKVYLPRVDTGVSAEAEPPKPIPRGNERILVVDDEEFIVTAVQNMLQHFGYKVTGLMDSRRALKLFSENPSQFDLVIADQTMPFMTGEDLGKTFMRIRPDIPVILCTGYSDLISSEEAVNMGFRGFIMKPFTVREGAELVRRVLDQKGPSNLSKKSPLPS